MATARVPLGAVQQIEINATGESDSPGLVMGNSDTLRFYNGTPYPVTIQFVCANGPVFDDIDNLPHNTWSTPQSPQKTQITTGYEIVSSVLGTHGPYSVEVTLNTQNPAPLLIEVEGAAPDESEVAIPVNGWIQFDLDAEYEIEWQPAGVFPSGTYGPGLTPSWQAATGNQDSVANYTLAPFNNLPGHGTVHISS
jgi:hypothetical protein